MADTSKRQQRKAARANSRDKWGYSKALSRKQRRAARRSVWSRTYATGAGTQSYTLNPGETIDRKPSGVAQCYFHVHGGGSMRAN